MLPLRFQMSPRLHVPSAPAPSNVASGPVARENGASGLSNFVTGPFASENDASKSVDPAALILGAMAESYRANNDWVGEFLRL
jgi:hypothetical protein